MLLAMLMEDVTMCADGYVLMAAVVDTLQTEAAAFAVLQPVLNAKNGVTNIGTNSMHSCTNSVFLSVKQIYLIFKRVRCA